MEVIDGYKGIKKRDEERYYVIGSIEGGGVYSTDILIGKKGKDYEVKKIFIKGVRDDLDKERIESEGLEGVGLEIESYAKKREEIERYIKGLKVKPIGRVRKEWEDEISVKKVVYGIKGSKVEIRGYIYESARDEELRKASGGYSLKGYIQKVNVAEGEEIVRVTVIKEPIDGYKIEEVHSKDDGIKEEVKRLYTVGKFKGVLNEIEMLRKAEGAVTNDKEI